MKTSVIAPRSLLRAALYFPAVLYFPVVLALLAWLLPARAEATVRVRAEIGGVAVDYRDHGPGCDATADVYLEPLAARVLVGRPVCGPERPGCLVRVVDRCGRHDRDYDGRCDKCERRGRHERRDRRYDRAGFAACEHSERCGACRIVEVGGCREHRGLTWVAGHYERTSAGRGRGNRVWVPGHWERAAIAYR